MPIYEYKCRDCGATFEIRQKFSDPVLTVCQECGGSIQKLISLGGFSLKGSGWYQQGYGEAAKPAACSAGKKSQECAGCPKAANE